MENFRGYRRGQTYMKNTKNLKLEVPRMTMLQRKLGAIDELKNQKSKSCFVNTIYNNTIKKHY